MLETGDDLYAHARSAALPSLRGDVPGAIAGSSSAALARGQAEGRPAEALARGSSGSSARSTGAGAISTRPRRSTARPSRRFRAITGPSPGSPRCMPRAGAGAEAVTLLEQAIAVIPQLDYVVALRRPHAAARPGGRRPSASTALAEHIGQLSALNRVLYNRELTWFYARSRSAARRGARLARRELARRVRTSTRTISWPGRSTRPARRARRAPRWRRRSARDAGRAALLIGAGMIEQR